VNLKAKSKQLHQTDIPGFATSVFYSNFLHSLKANFQTELQHLANVIRFLCYGAKNWNVLLIKLLNRSFEREIRKKLTISAELSSFDAEGKASRQCLFTHNTFCTLKYGS